VATPARNTQKGTGTSSVSDASRGLLRIDMTLSRPRVVGASATLGGSHEVLLRKQPS
jgi:hypothetical protein